MRFSLIVATNGRTEELSYLLQSLASQSYDKFEVIIVDQNDDDRISAVMQPFEQRLHLVHLRSKPGLSRSRNVGLRSISGDVVAFPDDDCSYPPDLLETVARLFENLPELDGLTGRCLDETTRVYHRPWGNSRARLINRTNIWALATSISIFLRRRVIEKAGFFDENLGLGSGTRWVSSEEMDYMIGALENGCKIRHDPTIVVLHPDLPPSSDPARVERSYHAGRSMGFVMKKRGYPFWMAFWWWIRAAGGALIYAGRLDFPSARLCLASLHGRVSGWFFDRYRKDAAVSHQQDT